MKFSWTTIGNMETSSNVLFILVSQTNPPSDVSVPGFYYVSTNKTIRTPLAEKTPRSQINEIDQNY